MLRFLLLSVTITAALVPFLPKVAFGLPAVVDINNPPTVILDPNSNSGTVIGNPINRVPTGVVYPINNSGTVIGNPINRVPTGVVNPINNFGTVIINPTNVNPPVQQSSCGSMVFGSPIPSPVPVDAYTGRLCR